MLEWGHLRPEGAAHAEASSFAQGRGRRVRSRWLDEGDEPYTHGDSEELLLVLAGRVHLQLDSELLDLSTGDSVNYRSSTPHRVSNPGDEAAEVLFVISPPSY